MYQITVPEARGRGKPGSCPHRRRAFRRVVCCDGREHIGEFCQDCRANVRGAGRWVPRREVRGPSALPIHADYRPGAGVAT